jgi:uncharacterized protein YgiM (DUF1202 family)
VLSSSSVYTAQDNTDLRLDKAAKSNILKTLSKGVKLQRLTMHYSGWSQVDLNGLSGWILSEKLTQTKPNNSANLVAKLDVRSNNKLLEKVKELTKNLEKLQLENIALSSTISDIKDLNAELSAHNNDIQAQIDFTDTGNNINILFALIFALFMGFIISVVIARFFQNKRDSFNTISRSY